MLTRVQSAYILSAQAITIIKRCVRNIMRWLLCVVCVYVICLFFGYILVCSTTRRYESGQIYVFDQFIYLNRNKMGFIIVFDCVWLCVASSDAPIKQTMGPHIKIARPAKSKSSLKRTIGDNDNVHSVLFIYQNSHPPPQPSQSGVQQIFHTQKNVFLFQNKLYNLMSS